MKRLKMISAALCILIPLAGCSVNKKAPESEAATDTSVTDKETSSHQVTVEDLMSAKIITPLRYTITILIL